MASRGHPRGTGQAPPTFDQPPVFDHLAFAEAVGIAAAAIAQASIASSQGRKLGCGFEGFMMYTFIRMFFILIYVV